MMVGRGTAPARPASLSACECQHCKVDVRLVPGPRLELLLGCCMLRRVWAVVLILETRQLGLGEPVGGLGSPDWLKKETNIRGASSLRCSVAV